MSAEDERSMEAEVRVCDGMAGPVAAVAQGAARPDLAP